MYKFMATMPKAVQKAMDKKYYIPLYLGLIAFIIMSPFMWLAHLITRGSDCEHYRKV